MDLVLTISVSLAVALLLGYLTQRLGLSPGAGKTPHGSLRRFFFEVTPA